MTTPTRVYQDFEPTAERVTEQDVDTLLLYLPGFTKEQLRVQLRNKNLIISGERQLQQNTWSRFRKEFPIHDNCDVNKISAKFETDILFVRQPKLITPAPKQDEENPPIAAPAPDKSLDEHNTPQKTAEEEKKPISNAEKIEAADAKEVSGNGLRKRNENNQGKASESESLKGVRENASEKGKGVCENAPEKKASDTGNEGELDKTIKSVLDNYKRAVGGFVAKLKTSKNAMSMILVLLVGLILGIYVSDSIKSWRKLA